MSRLLRRSGSSRAWARRGLLGTCVLALAMLGGVFLPPLLETHGLPGGSAIRTFYAPLCHQLEERSLTAGGAAFAVCARCTGLYVGGVAGLWIAALWVVGRRSGPRPLWLVWAAAPTLIDALLPWVGLGGLSNAPRAALAVPAGLLAGMFLAIGLHDLFRSWSAGTAPAGDVAWPPPDTGGTR